MTGTDIKITGTIEFVDLEAGEYFLNTSDDRRYRIERAPLHMWDSLAENIGRIVTIEGTEIRPDLTIGGDRGTPGTIIITSIKY